MKYIFNYSIFLLLLFIVYSCNFKLENTILLGEVKPFSTLVENQQFVQDVFSYDHASMLLGKINSKDSTILNGIEYETQTVGEGVKIRLNLTGTAASYTKEIAEHFTTFFAEKEEEYKEKLYRVRDATATAEYFIDLLEKQRYSNMWAVISPTWKEMTNEDDFSMLFQELVKKYEIAQGKKLLQSRVLQEKIRNLAGEFYVINYLHSEKHHIQIVLQPVGDDMFVSHFVIEPI